MLSNSQVIIFDGTNESVSFLDFVQQLHESLPISGPSNQRILEDLELTVPTHLYGTALRFYESLDAGCQLNWERLQSAMADRFPRGLRDGGRVRLSTEKWRPDGLQTRPKTPPTTRSSTCSVPSLSRNEENEVAQVGLEATVEKKRGRSRTISILSRSLPSTRAMESPHVTVHSFYLQSPLKWLSLPDAIRLDDHQAVAAARAVPLATVGSFYSEELKVGFTYTVHRGTRDIEFCHKILEPRSLFQKTHIEQVGRQTLSPEGGISRQYNVRNVVISPVTGDKWWKGIPRGKYVIQSYVRSREPGTGKLGIRNPAEIAGEITWCFVVN